MAIQLFEDQEEFVVKLRDALKAGHRSILGVASPAFGKTVVAGYITAEARAKSDASVWFAVHRKNLLRQTSKSFWKAKIEHGLLTSGKMRSSLPIQVGTIGTIHSRLSTLTPPKILFVDEAHLARGRMFETVIKWVLEAGGIVIGLTGTPQRLDGKALGSLFTVMVEAKSTRWLIEQGRLSDYDMYVSGVVPDMSGVSESDGDYNRQQNADVMNKPFITGDAISHWKQHAQGMRTVVYCCTVKHSKDTAAAFNAAGIPAVHVDADTTDAELKDACEGLATGKYLILCNCELVIEGFDLSAQVDMDVTLECCILLRPTKSLARYLQMVFRALRKKPYPAVILDHAGCSTHLRHGLPDDERKWSLAGRKKGSRRSSSDESDIGIQTCDKCRHVFRSGVSACPKCGAPVEFKERKIEQVDGELQKVERQIQIRERKQEQGTARTLEELVRVGVRRKLNNPAAWAANVTAAREGRKPIPNDFNEAKRILSAIRSEAQT